MFPTLSIHFVSDQSYSFFTSSSSVKTLLMTYVNSVVESNCCPICFFKVNFFKYLRNFPPALFSFDVSQTLLDVSLHSSIHLYFHIHQIAFVAYIFNESLYIILYIKVKLFSYGLVKSKAYESETTNNDVRILPIKQASIPRHFPK